MSRARDLAGASATILSSSTSSTVTVGYPTASYAITPNLDSVNYPSGFTPSIANGAIQHGTIVGDVTINVPSDTEEGYIEIELTNGSVGGYVVTLSGYTVLSGAYDSTADVVNLFRISKHQNATYLEIVQP